jgi:hypothetical protein
MWFLSRRGLQVSPTTKRLPPIAAPAGELLHRPTHRCFTQASLGALELLLDLAQVEGARVWLGG